MRDLRFQNYIGQDLTGTDFSDSDLTGSKFAGAILTGCLVTNAVMGDSAKERFRSFGVDVSTVKPPTGAYRKCTLAKCRELAAKRHNRKRKAKIPTKPAPKVALLPKHEIEARDRDSRKLSELGIYPGRTFFMYYGRVGLVKSATTRYNNLKMEIELHDTKEIVSYTVPFEDAQFLRR